MFDAIAQFRPYRVRGANRSTPEGDPHLQVGKPVVIFEAEGAGQITRLHITVGQTDPQIHRTILLRIYWDGEQSPSVLCPLGDFFCDAFAGTGVQFATPFFSNHGAHLVSYLPMPFARGCRIELENQGNVDDDTIATDVVYQQWDRCPDDLGRLHACWRRENPTVPGKRYTVLRAKGRGHYIGCNLSVQALGRPTLSFLEGITNVYVDGEPEPVYKVWGTEDYLGGSYYFQRGPYAGPFAGCTLLEEDTGRFAGYRLQIPDAIPFERDLSVEFNHGDSLGSGPIMTYDGTADYSSVAYWYQAEPHDPSAYQGHTCDERRIMPVTIADARSRT